MGDIPQTRDSDHEDVSLALQVARSQLSKGDLAEAVKWLRKAADSAFDNDDDRRGIELSKAAAELQATPPKPALKPSMPAPRSVAPPGPKVPKPVVPTAAQVKARSEAPPPPHRPIAQPSSPTSKKPSRGRMPSQHKTRKLDEEEATRELNLRKHHVPAAPPAPVADEWPTESVQATDLVEIPPVPVSVAQALRVAVSRGADGNAVCRLLDEHGLRPGEHDAMLVALTPESDLVGLFKG